MTTLIDSLPREPVLALDDLGEIVLVEATAPAWTIQGRDYGYRIHTNLCGSHATACLPAEATRFTSALAAERALYRHNLASVHAEVRPL